MIEINSLTKMIKRKKVLDRITYRFEEGHIYGIRGINGSGKTMLLRAISGLIRPTDGTVAITGKKLWEDISFPPSIGVLIENPAFLSEFTGRENLELLATLTDKVTGKDIDNILALVGLTPNADKKYRKYSLGMKQRLGIAAAVMGNPEIVLLDEPTNALDDNGTELLISLIKNFGGNNNIVIICSHNQDILNAVCDTFLYMEEGAFVEKG